MKINILAQCVTIILFSTFLSGCVAPKQHLRDLVARQEWSKAQRYLARNPSIATESMPQVGGGLLHFLVLSGARPELVKLAISKGADPRNRDAIGDTPLHIASQQGEMAVVVVLLEAGCPPDIKSGRYGDTPLMRAAMTGHCRILKTLLEYGADPNATSDHPTGLTPLAYAVGPFSKGGACVQFLVEAGADARCVDTKGHSLAHYIKKYADSRDGSQ